SLPFLAAGSLVEAGGILGRAAFGEPSGVVDSLVRYGIPLSLLYMLAAEPLVAAIREGAEGVKHAFQTVFMEFFETVLMVIGNTASFLRIMGLSLAHSGIMFGFTVLAESVLTANPATILAAAAIYAFGNMLAIGLESIIVFAHTLRLHFYEWFSKFYVGGGVEYRPVRPAFLPALSTA
ncbi:TPA: hypothetical protein EYP13_03430, partial [Candidatus Micrarchaeota archaeon]|nr:hypothetical protein [Candidatus Micrarchaeota archaeon]